MTDVTVSETRGSRRRRWRVYLLAGIVLMLIAFVSLDAWAARRVNRATRALEERYGTLAEDSLRTAAVPAEQNRARLVRAAAALSVPPTTSIKAFLTEAGRSQQPPPVTAELRDFVESNREALNTAARFTSRQRSSWEIEPDGNNIPGLLEIRRLSDILVLAGLVELEAGRTEETAEMIGAGLALAASMRQENQLIVQLIRMGVALQQVDAIHRLIATAEPSASSLQELAARLAENRTPDPLRLALIGELKHGRAMFLKLEQGRRDGGSDHLVVGLDGGSSNVLSALGRVGRPLVRVAHASYLERMNALIELQAGPRPKPPFPERQDSFLLNWLGWTAGLERAVQSGDDFRSAQGAAEIAVALRRYRVDRNSYPDNLAVLVPGYLSELPIDPFTGQAPVYERRGAGFTLQAQRYSAQPPHAQPAAWVITK